LARKILLADDSVTAQNMGRKILTDAGYEVITVNNGSAALKKITEARPDLIVLDVYMPGYSGLEVCQRTKENRETGHIPVLLTVGKLEPFKQDEARRVRADAFIIKPFEASELLAALGKLEDKVAPRDRGKDNHLPLTTMASFERLVSENAPQYGDQESGWKARLKIPQVSPGASEREPDAPESAAPLGDRAEEGESGPGAPAPVLVPFDRPLPPGIPQDITPDEIAAISAAAARVSMGLSVGKEIERASARARTDAEEMAETSFQTAEMRIASASEGATQGMVPDEPSPIAKSGSEPAPDEAMPAEPPSIREPGQPAFEARFGAIGAEEAPSCSGNPIASYPPEPALSTAGEPGTVTEAAAAAHQAATVTAGSRWIAEKVPVEAHEAVLVLEREMHKAHAAFAAFEYAASSDDDSAPPDRDDEPAFNTMAPPPIGSPVPVAEASAATGPATGEPSAKQAALAAAAAVGFHEIQRPAEVARPPASPFAPPAPAVDESRHAVAAFGGPQPFAGPEFAAPEQETAPMTASSGSEPVHQASGPAREIMDQPDRMAAASADAWASWKDIRKIDSKSEAEPAPAAAVDSVSADASLSSIVDRMLAELKPKLVAELAKKLEKKTE
jgi:twitching motility two-component system response regulator PilH